MECKNACVSIHSNFVNQLSPIVVSKLPFVCLVPACVGEHRIGYISG